MKCIICQEPASPHPKYLVITIPYLAPNTYFTCDDHREVFLKCNDIYNDDGSRKGEIKNND